MGGRAAGIWRPVVPYSDQLHLHTWKGQWATCLSTGANTASWNLEACSPILRAIAHASARLERAVGYQFEYWG